MNFLSLSSMLEFSVDNSTEDPVTTISPDDYRVCSKEGRKFKTVAILALHGGEQIQISLLIFYGHDPPDR